MAKVGKLYLMGLLQGAATSHKNPEGLPKKPKGNSSKVHLKHITKLGVSGKKGSKTHQDTVPNEMKKHGSSSKSSVSSASKACNEKPGKHLIIPFLGFAVKSLFL